MTDTHYDDLFSQGDYKNEYSTFIEQLEQSTQKLMNEVFNTQYVPQINQQETYSTIKKKHKQSNVSLMSDSRKKQMINDFNRSARTMTTKCQSQRQLSDSFIHFLDRNEKWKSRKIQRAEKQTSRKQQDELKGLTFTPTILRASKQKLQPIYERCLDIQKQKQKTLTFKRMQKQRNIQQVQSSYTYHPQLKIKSKPRTLDEYLRDKQIWSAKKQQTIQNSKIIREAQKYEECLFQPILVAKYNKVNKMIRKGQKVEDRLLRSLQRSIDKQQANTNSNK